MNEIANKLICDWIATPSSHNYLTNEGACASETPKPDCAKIGNGHVRITYLGAD